LEVLILYFYNIAPRFRPEPEGAAPIAPYPPLCFKINARPPQGYLYYFAYGTDMNAER
jgi:hypothetical protein